MGVASKEAMASSLLKVIAQCPRCGSALLSSSREVRRASNFPPNRVVVVRKTTRLEYEQNRNGLTTEEELQNRVWECDFLTIHTEAWGFC